MSKPSVIEFLQNCLEYADASIQRKEKRGDNPEIISEWRAYRNYTQYALEEVEKGDLDHWFTRSFSKADLEVDIDELDHSTRSKWLASTASPRPLALVSTRDGEKENVAPMTSMSVVSNTPPLIVMSLSQNREAKKRDTYLNLVKSGECELQFLCPTKEAAKDVDLASTPTDESEWDLLDCEGPIHPLAVVVMKCKLVEDYPLPEGAVARLVVLRVESMIVPSSIPPREGLSLLCQHGVDRLTPSPQDWGHVATHYRS